AANIRRWLAFDPGVDQIDLCIAVSEVTPRSKKDERWYRTLADRLEQSGKFKIVDIIFKPNLGRDFSSWEACLRRFELQAHESDNILMINRSALGPSMADWYVRYAEPFAHRPDLALCGSQINFYLKTHVQSYVWMSRFSILRELLDNFPGRNSRTRLEAVFT